MYLTGIHPSMSSITWNKYLAGKQPAACPAFVLWISYTCFSTASKCQLIIPLKFCVFARVCGGGWDDGAWVYGISSFTKYHLQQTNPILFYEFGQLCSTALFKGSLLNQGHNFDDQSSISIGLVRRKKPRQLTRREGLLSMKLFTM